MEHYWYIINLTNTNSVLIPPYSMVPICMAYTRNAISLALNPWGKNCFPLFWFNLKACLAIKNSPHNHVVLMNISSYNKIPAIFIFGQTLIIPYSFNATLFFARNFHYIWILEIRISNSFSNQNLSSFFCLLPMPYIAIFYWLLLLNGHKLNIRWTNKKGKHLQQICQAWK